MNSESATVTALITSGASFPGDDPDLMTRSDEQALNDPRRAAVWKTEHRLLKAALLYVDTAQQFDSSPAWTNALLIDAGMEVRGPRASLTHQAYDTRGVAADAARAYYRDLALAAANGLTRGLGFVDAESLARRQAAWLARPETVVVAPPPASEDQSATAVWESARPVLVRSASLERAKWPVFGYRLRGEGAQSCLLADATSADAPRACVSRSANDEPDAPDAPARRSI